MTKCIAFLLYICTCKHLGGSFICSLRPFHLLSFIDVSIIWGLFPLLHPCKLSSRELSFHFALSVACLYTFDSLFYLSYVTRPCFHMLLVILFIVVYFCHLFVSLL